MVQPNIDVSTEAGKFAGGFVVAVVSETIQKIFDRKSNTNEEIVESVRDLKPLIEQLAFFKGIHSFAQEFIENRSSFLFGKGDINGGYFGSSDTIQDAWKTNYVGKYETKIESHDLILANFEIRAMKQASAPTGQVSSAQTQRILTSIHELTAFVPNCLNLSKRFTKEIKETAETALSGMIIPNLSAWSSGERKEDLVRQAENLLGRADDILAHLIEVLDQTYTHGLNL